MSHPDATVPTIRVRAVRRGSLYDIERNVGDEFACAIKDLALVTNAPAGFETGWMTAASDADRQALEDIPAFVARHTRRHAEVLAEEAARRVAVCEAALAKARASHAAAASVLAKLKDGRR